MVKSFSTNVKVAIKFPNPKETIANILSMQLRRRGYKLRKASVGIVLACYEEKSHNVMPLTINKTESEVWLVKGNEERRIAIARGSSEIYSLFECSPGEHQMDEKSLKMLSDFDRIVVFTFPEKLLPKQRIVNPRVCTTFATCEAEMTIVDRQGSNRVTSEAYQRKRNTQPSETQSKLMQLGNNDDISQPAGTQNLNVQLSGTELKTNSKPSSKVDRQDTFYSLCKQPAEDYAGSNMVQCDLCDQWYHCHCIGIVLHQVEHLQNWSCIQCERKKAGQVKNSGEASSSLSTIPIGMEKLTITDFYCLAKAIQVIINSDSTEAGFENVRGRIFSSATGLPAERMTSPLCG